MISAFQSANAVVVAAKSAYGLVMTVMQQPAHGVMVAREAAFPALAIVAIVASADIRIPLGLPGHRGLVWLTVLVAVTLLTRRRETVVVVGAASTLSAAVLDAAGPWMSGRYLAAAMLLYAAAAIPAVRGRPWLLSGAAAPIHLVALAGSIFAVGRAGALPATVWNGMAERAEFHLGFGLLAGLLGWALASAVNRLVPAGPASGAPARRWRG